FGRAGHGRRAAGAEGLPLLPARRAPRVHPRRGGRRAAAPQAARHPLFHDREGRRARHGGRRVGARVRQGADPDGARLRQVRPPRAQDGRAGGVGGIRRSRLQRRPDAGLAQAAGLADHRSRASGPAGGEDGHGGQGSHDRRCRHRHLDPDHLLPRRYPRRAEDRPRRPGGARSGRLSGQAAPRLLAESVSTPLKRTPLYAEHVAAGARMVPFGGWEMPVQYTGIIEEHRATRGAVGLFDVSHMGEFEVEGPGALTALQHLTTNDVAALEVGQIQYSVLCHPNGTIVDDLTVYRMGDTRYMITVNAGNIDKDWVHVTTSTTHIKDARWRNASEGTGLIAVQGPQ